MSSTYASFLPHNAFAPRKCINPTCPHPLLGDFDCDRVCNSCGVEQGPNISHDTEYRIFADDEDKNADKRRADNAHTPLEVDEYEATGISRMGNRTEADTKRLLRQRQTGALLVKLTERGMIRGMISADECRDAGRRGHTMGMASAVVL